MILLLLVIELFLVLAKVNWKFWIDWIVNTFTILLLIDKEVAESKIISINFEFE